MDSSVKLSRPMNFALLSALGAGIVATLMIVTFIDMLHWVFIPSVMIMVYISAYFAFRRQMRGRGELVGKKIFTIALEVGTLTHFYTFALYLPAYFFLFIQQEFSIETLSVYLYGVVVGGLVSLIAFVWIAVPLYAAVGYLLKSMEKNDFLHEDELTETDILTDFTN
jgi:hypothetical protein